MLLYQVSHVQRDYLQYAGKIPLQNFRSQ